MATTGKKVMAVGDSGCGKSSLLNVFSKNEVLDVHTPVTFVNEVVDIVVDGKEVTLSLWVSPGEKFGQMAGSEEYKSLRKLTYSKTEVVLMCFSIDSPDSLENIQKRWMPEVEQFCPTAKIVLVGNKNDLRMSEDASLHLAESNQEFVTMENGHAMAEKIGAYAYLECSAKLNYGVKEVFGTAARAIFQ